MKKKLVRISIVSIFFLILIFGGFFPGIVKAEEKNSTPSSSFAQKLEEFKKEVASRAAAIKLEVDKKLQNKFFYGTVADKGLDKITLTTSLGDKTVLVNEYTDYRIKAKGVSSLKDLAKDDLIAALGDIDDKNNLNAKRIVKLSKIPLATESGKVIYFGEVMSKNEPFINIKLKDGSKTIQSLSKTVIRRGSEEAVFGDIKNNKPIAVVGNMRGNRQIEAKFIYIVPITNILTKDKTASEPAKLLKPATPSGAPKKKS